MVKYNILKLRYLFKIKDFTPRKILVPKLSAYKQTAGNCWIYSTLNNLYLNTGIKVNTQEVKNYIASYGFNPEGTTGNDFAISAVLLCSFLDNLKLGINIRAYQVDVMTQPKLFGKMLLNGYSFIYSRDCHNNVLQDILDDKEIDDIIITKGAWHAVNICFINKKLTEYGSRGDESIYNNFNFKTTDIFIKSIRAGAISSRVIFLDFQRENV